VITASALAPNCAYAKVLSARRAPSPDKQTAMNRGTQFHAAVEAWVRTGTLPVVPDPEMQGWIDLLASQWQPPPRDVFVELAWGLWDDGFYAAVDEPEPHVYVARGPRPGRRLLTAGRADVAWIEGNTLTVVDIKTGVWPVAAADVNLQVNAAGLALANCFFLPGYVPAIYYARDGVWDIGDRVDLPAADIWERVREAASLPLEPLPGPHCSSCWERRACPKAEQS
jgi:hypothetical protein